MKKIFGFILSAAMLVSLASCGGTAQSVGLIQSGTLKVGMEIGYPPFEYYTEDMTPVGLDVDIATEIANKLDVEVEFVNTQFDMVLPSLETNQFDIAVSAITIDADRLQQVDFSAPYVENWQAIVVKKGSPKVESMEALAGKKIGVQEGTTSDEMLEDLIAAGSLTAEVSPYAQILAAFEDLSLDRLDCVLTDSTVADGYIAREPDMYEISWLQRNEAGAVAEEFAVAVKKGNADLLKAVNEVLAEMEESGKLDELRGEWLN